jgi:epoxyqueuosine reductase
MSSYQNLSSAILNEAGLNCHAVFDIALLPLAVRDILFERCPQAQEYHQLILIGHAGTQFWSALQAAMQGELSLSDAHPVDDFTVAKVHEFMRAEVAGVAEVGDGAYQIVYPGAYTISLQELGKLAGWHHASPFMVGINSEYGPWFAYRAVVLTNSNFPVSAAVIGDAPCATCSEHACISNCPPKALEGGEFHLLKCLQYRQQENSLCKDTCLARLSCPVGSEHRYTEQQMNYHYGQSMRLIK